MTSIFYPLLISMLPPPPTLFLPPLPLPLPPAVRSLARSATSIYLPFFTPAHHRFPPLYPLRSSPSLPSPSTFYATTLGPSVLRENVHVHRAHSRRNNHFFVPDNTCAASPRRVNSLPFAVSPVRRRSSTSLALFHFSIYLRPSAPLCRFFRAWLFFLPPPLPLFLPFFFFSPPRRAPFFSTTRTHAEIELTWTRQFSIFPSPVGIMTFFSGRRL